MVTARDPETGFFYRFKTEENIPEGFILWESAKKEKTAIKAVKSDTKTKGK